MAGQGRDIGAGIAALAVLLDQHGELVVPVQRRLALAQFVLVQFQPLRAVVAADAPGQGLGLERRAVGEGEQHALAGDQLADAGFLGQLAVQRRRIRQQRLQRPRRCAATFAAVEPACQEAPQPGQQARQIGPADRQRTQRIHQIARDLLPQPRRRHRNDRTGIEQRAVAVAGRLLAARAAGFDDRDRMPVAQQFDGRGQADHAAADDDDPAHPAAEMMCARMVVSIGPVPKRCSSASVTACRTRFGVAEVRELRVSARSGVPRQ